MTARRKVLIGGLAAFAVLLGALAFISVAGVSHPGIARAASSRAGDAAGVPVSIGRMSVSLLRGAAISNLAVGEPGSEFFTAESVRVKANFFQLARRRLDIEQVLIDRPVFTIGGEYMLPPIMPAEAEDPDTGFLLSIKSVRINSGRVVGSGKTPPVLADQIRMHADSAVPGGPVSLYAGARLMEAAEMEFRGTVDPGRNFLADVEGTVSLDWEKARLPDENLKGRGISLFRFSAAGTPDNLEANFSADISGEEIAYAGAFIKPAGEAFSIGAKASVTAERVEVREASLELGSSLFTLSGSASLDLQNVLMSGAGSADIANISNFIPALAPYGAAGSARLQATIRKSGTGRLAAAGQCRIKDWQVSFMGGDSLDFEFEAGGGMLAVNNIRGRIGEGSLAGQGLIRPGGEYEFSIEGIDIEIEKLLGLKKNDARGLNVTGAAGLAAAVSGTAGGFDRMDGRGSFRAVDGTISSLPAFEKFLPALGLAEIMPVNYREIGAHFTMERGVVRADARMLSETIEVKTERAEFDLVKMEKQVYADLAIPPRFVRSMRESLGDIGRLLEIDERGYANIGLVWDGPLAEASPNLAASLLRTGSRGLLEMLRGR